MKTLHPLALVLPLLLAGCKDDDCDRGSGGSNHDQPYKFMISFYMTDAATGQPLIQDSLAPYRPDSVSVRQFSGTIIWSKLTNNYGPQYGYISSHWELGGTEFNNPAPFNDTAYFYIRVAYNDTDTLKIIRHSTGDCKKPWQYTYLFRGVPQPFINYLPGQGENYPSDNINVINIRKPMP